MLILLLLLFVLALSREHTTRGRGEIYGHGNVNGEVMHALRGTSIKFDLARICVWISLVSSYPSIVGCMKAVVEHMKGIDSSHSRACLHRTLDYYNIYTSM